MDDGYSYLVIRVEPRRSGCVTTYRKILSFQSSTCESVINNFFIDFIWIKSLNMQGHYESYFRFIQGYGYFWVIYINPSLLLNKNSEFISYTTNIFHTFIYIFERWVGVNYHLKKYFPLFCCFNYLIRHQKKWNSKIRMNEYYVYCFGCMFFVFLMIQCFVLNWMPI